MSTLAFNNYRLAQFNQGSQVGTPQPAPPAQAPQQAPPQATTPASKPANNTLNVLLDPSAAAFNYANSQMDSSAKKEYKESYDKVKKSISNDLKIFPSNIKYNPYLYKFALDLINLIVRDFDTAIIWLLEKGINMYTWVRYPGIATAVKLAQKNPQQYEIVKNIGGVVLKRIQNFRGIKNVVGMIDAARDVKYNKLLSSIGQDDLENILKYDTSSPNLTPEKIKQFLNNPNSLSFDEQKLVMKHLKKNAPNSYGKIAQNLKFNDLLANGTRMGENASVYKQGAVKAFRSIEKALPKLAGFLEKATPFLDVFVSSADFIDWLRVWGNTGWDKMDDVQKSRLLLSAVKALATVCYFIPPLAPFAVVLNLVISIVQSYGVEVAEQAGYWASGMTKEQAEKIQQVSETVAGYEPKDPMVNAIYKLIKGWITNDLTNNPNIHKGKNIRQILDEYVNKYYNQQKDKFQVSWIKNLSDPKMLELMNALSMVMKKIKTANSSYNNRRSVICPSI
jgi:hypothetical protein